VRRWKLDPGPSELDCRLDETGPGKAAVRAPQGVQTRRHAGHRTGRRPDRVVDELFAERHLEEYELRSLRGLAEPRYGDEAIEPVRTGARGVPVDAVPAAEQSRHERLGDAGGERRGDGCVGGRASLLQNLEACGRGRRMSRRNRRLHQRAFQRAVRHSGRQLGCTI
jgi:hypothetical protein